MSPLGPRGGAGHTATEEVKQVRAQFTRDGFAKGASKHCVGCGIKFLPVRSWYQTCPKCWSYHSLDSVVRRFLSGVR